MNSQRRWMCNRFFLTLLMAAALSRPASSRANEITAERLLHPNNLVAWCIVPFDASNRTPQQRAEMLNRLGLKRVAYDWRQKHVAEFEEEILQYKQHQLEFFAFWSWHDSMEPLIRKHEIHPQIWSMLPNPKADVQTEKVREAAEAILPLVRKTSMLGCRLGLYNHGGWAGEPANMVAVCEYLHQSHDAPHVGIVYNFHHGHEHIESFEDHLNAMLPHLICLNINGMAPTALVRSGSDKILTLGQGEHEVVMLRIVLKSGYSGPIGILDHRSDRDTEEVLQENLAGLNGIRQSLSE